ncbi:Uma2 family endonuclease [bacterium]|nr:MAG: Uma2 family endonuclease [bacterium]
MAIAGGRPTKRWTAAEVERLIALGAIDHPERYELLNGELKEKMGQNLPHIAGIAGTVEALRAVFGGAFYVATQCPIKGDPHSEPEPDAAVYRGDLREFQRVGPRLQNLALVIEISDTSLLDDREEKAAIYARFGVPEYWIVNVRERTLEVRRAPEGTGWGQGFVVGEVGTISPLERPEAAIPVADLLPPLP